MNKTITHYEYMEFVKYLLNSVKLHIANLLIKHPKLTLYSCATALILGILSVVVLNTTPKVSAHSDHINQKYFTSITVEAGDTLWDIANEYRSLEYATNQEFINEVKEINHITGDEITTGCNIIIPYFAEHPIN